MGVWGPNRRQQTRIGPKKAFRNSLINLSADCVILEKGSPSLVVLRTSPFLPVDAEFM